MIHAISLPPEEFSGTGVIGLFTNQLNPQAHPYYQTLTDLKVSSHFFIRRDGEIIQFVPCLLRAWHAGASSWQGRTCCNDFSIGIELEGSDNQPFEPQQYTRLIKLTQVLQATYPIRDIAGHTVLEHHLPKVCKKFWANLSPCRSPNAANCIPSRLCPSAG